VAPEFADAEEEKLYDFLNIQLESDLNLKRSKSPFHSSFFQLF